MKISNCTLVGTCVPKGIDPFKKDPDLEIRVFFTLKEDLKCPLARSFLTFLMNKKPKEVAKHFNGLLNPREKVVGIDGLPVDWN